MGVTGRLAEADCGMATVRTKSPDVVISSTYTGFVTPILYVLPVSSPTRTTARLPPVNGTGAAVGVKDGVFVELGVNEEDSVLGGVTDAAGVVEGDAVSDAEIDAVSDAAGVLESVATLVEVDDGSAPGGRVADADAVLVTVGTAVTDAELVVLADDVALGEEERVCAPDADEVAVGSAVTLDVGDEVEEAGTKTTLWYSTLADDGPAIVVHKWDSESYRTTRF